MFKTILFDLSGTLLLISEKDEDIAAEECCNILRAKVNVNVSAEQYKKAMAEAFNNYNEIRFQNLIEIDEIGFYYRYFYPVLDMKESNISVEITRRLIQTWIDFAVKVELNSGARELLVYLKNKGKKIGIVSDLLGHLYRIKLKELGILDFFDFISISSETGVRKPNPMAFHYCLQGLKSCAEEAIFIGNNPIDDIKGANNIGLKTMFLKSKSHPRCEQADFFVSNLHELLNVFKENQFNAPILQNKKHKNIENEFVLMFPKIVKNLQAVLFFGSIVKDELKFNSDIDVLLIAVDPVSFEDTQGLAQYQRSFNKKSLNALSIHLFDQQTLDYWKVGRNILRFVTILRNSKLIYGHFNWPELPDKETVRQSLKEEVWEVRRIFLYNSSNLNPTGRIFNNRDNCQCYSDDLLESYLLNHHLRMLKHLLSAIDAISHLFVMSEPIEKLRVVIQKLESEKNIYGAKELHKVIEDIYCYVCCSSF